MTNADKLRDILELTDCSRGQWEPLLDALVAERDEWEVAAKKISGARNRWKKRAEAAEAENVLLREALTKILYASENNQEMSIIARFDAIHAAARAALGEDA